jgi:hypothetical protein
MFDKPILDEIQSALYKKALKAEALRVAKKLLGKGKTMAIGFYVEGEEMICEQCAHNPMYNLALTDVDMEGYPDGFTCADCGETVGVPDDWEPTP